MTRSEASTPREKSVLVNRSFDAPANLVWRSYVEPELFSRWCLGPPGWSMPACEMDVRSGGRYRWRWQDDKEGNEFGFVGEFKEVIVESRLVHTQMFDPGGMGDSMGENPSTVTVGFRELDSITHVATTIDFASKEDRDAALSTGMTDGMEMSYKKLADVAGELG